MILHKQCLDPEETQESQGKGLTQNNPSKGTLVVDYPHRQCDAKEKDISTSDNMSIVVKYKSKSSFNNHCAYKSDGWLQ